MVGSDDIFFWGFFVYFHWGSGSVLGGWDPSACKWLVWKSIQRLHGSCPFSGDRFHLGFFLRLPVCMMFYTGNMNFAHVKSMAFCWR